MRSASAWPEPEKNKFHDIFVYWGTLLGRAAQSLENGQGWPEPKKSECCEDSPPESRAHCKVRKIGLGRASGMHRA